MKKRTPLILLLLAVCAILLPLLLPSCANTTKAPSGGKKDTIPPYIIDIRPLPGVVGVPLEGARFVFTFNEYASSCPRRRTVPRRPACADTTWSSASRSPCSPT